MVRLLVIGIIVGVPQVVCAGLTISEIAWMGSTVSANDEWIELYNDGPTITVDGWYLTDGMNLQIDLAGTVSAQDYIVLERTDDDSAPGAAFLVYTGALANSGATLTLRRADGSVVDQVAGGDNWEQVGGDNTTKETAQLTTAGWGTAQPTPGSPNVQPEKDVVTPPTKESPTRSSSGSGVVSVRKRTTNDDLPPVPPELTLSITAPHTIYVNQPVPFTAERAGLTKGILQSLSYRWNFGDLTTATGSSPVHHYAYPGTYIVTLYGWYKDYHAETRLTVTVLPRQLSIVRLSSGDVQLHNNGPREIDVSGFTVAGVTLPPRSMMVSKGTITIPAERVDVSAQYVVADARQSIAAVIDEMIPMSDEAVSPVMVAPPSTQHVASPSTIVPSSPATFTFAPTASAAELAADDNPATTTTTVVSMESAQGERQTAVVMAATSSSTSPSPTSPYVYISIALLFGLLVGIYTRYV